MATLLLELSLTRIFSVVFYYHFAFLAISIALFGLGAGGVFSYVVADWKAGVFTKLGRLSAVNSVLVILAVYVVLSQEKDPGYGALALIYFTTALPFFVSGAIVSLAISETIERVNRVYFFDLAGAAAGCLLLVPLLNYLGGPNTAIAVAVLFAATAAIWHSLAGSLAGRAGSVALALLLAGLILFNDHYHLLGVTFAKGQKLENEQFVKWNSFSRIALKTDPKNGSRSILIDADAATGIAQFDFDHLSTRERRELLYQGPGMPYILKPAARTLIIGPGGGWDVARALASGSTDVTGVEINPIIATTIMRQRFPQYSNGLYLRPDVHIFVEDGRSFVRRSHDKFQVIQATLVDTWASTAAGAFALSENNLYTTDAFDDYLAHLTGDGVLAFTRWGLAPPRESLRVVSLAMDALSRLGQREPWRNVLVGREGRENLSNWGAMDTVLISRTPFRADDLARARMAFTEARMEPIYVPGEMIPNPFTELLRSKNPAQFQRDYQFDISPVSDNRPFFFYTVQPRDIWAFVSQASRATADYKINRAVPLLFALLAVSVLATLVILALPPFILRARLPREKPVIRFLLYFLCIGAGYILVEVALIQKFVLFLGHPTYALTVVIFSMLISSGLGSYLSRRLVEGSKDRLPGVLGVIAGSVVALGLIASWILPAAVGLPVWLKAAITVLLIFPAGFAMGIPFPTGLRRLEEYDHAPVRWAWSLNAAASVLGSVGALMCAIYLGLMQTLLVGALLYGAALLAALRAPARLQVTAAELVGRTE